MDEKRASRTDARQKSLVRFADFADNCITSGIADNTETGGVDFEE
jgi:hypothetical protein